MQTGAEMVRKCMSEFTLNDLEKRVQQRARENADVSYTRKLLDRGVIHCAKKLGEEAVEAAIAAVGEDRERMVSEAADVLYHLLVVLHVRGITLAEVEAELGARTRQSGLDEKAARKSG
jgi:phosphoribosyl-ATP pyrophosphohydrolase